MYEKIDQNKSAIDSRRPFTEHMSKQLREYYKIGLTWASNSIEGNTLTISETKVLLEDGLTVGGKPLKDIFEAVGHGKAYDYMITLVHSDDITENMIQNIHRLFYSLIDENEAGKYRSEEIIVSGTDYVFPAPEEIADRIKDLSFWIKTERNRFHPVEFAALLHLKFVTIHPFIDGNGRTARLLMNLALLQKGYQMAVIPPVCKVDYNSCIRLYQNKGQPDLFVKFISEQVYETQKELMRMLHIK